MSDTKFIIPETIDIFDDDVDTHNSNTFKTNITNNNEESITNNTITIDIDEISLQVNDINNENVVIDTDTENDNKSESDSSVDSVEDFEDIISELKYDNEFIQEIYKYVIDEIEKNIKEFKNPKFSLKNEIIECIEVFMTTYLYKNFKIINIKNSILCLFYECFVNDMLFIIKNIINNDYLDRSYNEIYPYERIYLEETKEEIKEKIDIIREKDSNNPEQRTPEWYLKRHNMISASVFSQAFATQGIKNSLIYKKCEPMNIERYNPLHTNINSAFHWGTRFEPVSQNYYEYKYNCKIEEYGCITHDEYDFFGASPDGINVTPESPYYGYMIEIKNVVSRKITGIPKKEYWVQTQLQMEVCKLNNCHFLECEFKEYSCDEDFYNDGDTFNLTEDEKYKGIYVMFYDNKLGPLYEYPKFNIGKDEFDVWYKEIIEKNNIDGREFARNIYWKLNQVSCVYIPRNKKWFDAIKDEAIETWKTIEYERENGYEHRKPKSRKRNIDEINIDKIENTINQKNTRGREILFSKFNKIRRIDE